MAKLRRNHGSGARGSSFGASLLRLAIIFAVIVAGIILLYPYASGTELPTKTTEPRLYLPTGPSDQVIDHSFYSLGYEEEWELPRWVAYQLTPKQVSERRVKRRDDFRPDPLVRTGSAQREDYRRSGYTRGHLVPAGDMAFSETAMSESFFYSNIAPQLAEHNGAVWRELEETARNWVQQKGATYIVTGPIVGPNPQRVGANEVAVPDAFYRVMLTTAGEGIGFIIPHERQTAPLEAFAVSIDSVEAATGLDFFPELPQLATPEVEATYHPARWPHDERRYQQRLQSWNKQR